MRAKNIKKALIIFLFTLTFTIRPAVADTAGVLMGFAFSVMLFETISCLLDDGKTDVTISPITADDVTFTEPDTKNLTLTNPNNQETTIDNPTFNNVFNVSAGDLSSCQPIPAGGTCEIPLTATEEAYGHGTVDIEYDGGKTTTNVSVVVTSLDLYKCKTKNTAETKCDEWENSKMPSDKDIVLEAEKSPQFYRYTNVGSKGVNSAYSI